MKDKKARIIVWSIALGLALVLLVVGGYFFVKYQSYSHMEITKTYKNVNKDNANYISCMNGILRYSRDGVALLSKQGKEQWNQPSQLKNPTVEICGDSLAVADKGGTTILVFEKKGLKGEIKTTRPIQKVSISSQGIVCAILKDEEVPLVMCYDAKGNILVEHKVSVASMGYPMDATLSLDGKTLLVSYLKTEGSSLTGVVAYYYFGSSNAGDKNHMIFKRELKNTIVPVVAFLNKETSLIVTDSSLLLYEGLTDPKEIVQIEMRQEIQRVAYSDSLIAVLTKKEGGGVSQLHTYNLKGKKLASVDVDKEYIYIKTIGDQVIMYDGQLCSIYMKNGVCRYEGKLEENILEIFPLNSLNKYMVINASGFHEMKLVK